MRRQMPFKRALIFIIIMALTAVFAAPAVSFADEASGKTVRVGWHEPPYFIRDASGRQSGYSYEYQRKVAAYTGWKYEYVEGNWSELMQKLRNGEIDLLSDVSYTEERSKDMLFSSLPMGTEAYYVFTSPDNTEITADNISSLNGKRVGVTKGTIQKEFFLDWEEKHGISAEIIEMELKDEESLKLLGDKYDAYITMDVYGSPETAVPVCKIGSSDFYFAVSKDRADLLSELDTALNRIQDENKYYDQQLHDKYLKSTETNRYVSTAEKEWLASHGTIRVGYQDNYLAFCAKDEATGRLTGALKDYLDYASSAFLNAKLKFEAVSYPTAAAALEALKKGEIDCMFPANLTDHDTEQLDLIVSPPLMRTEMDAVVRASEQKEFLKQEQVTVAVNEGNTNYDMFLADHYPGWQRKYFADTPAGLEAVADKEADCVIISNYRYSNISKQCEKLHLTTVYTGVEMDYCFAVREGDTSLYSIITRITGIVPEASVHKYLTYYSTEDVKIGFLDFVKENLFIVMTVIASVLLIIVILLLRSIRAEKKVRAEKHLIKDLNKRVFVDALTSVRNKGAFSDHIKKLQERVDAGEQPEFAIGIFDCNDLKTVNDKYGHDKGDIYLKTACRLICKVFEHSPVFRIGGDEFAAVLQNDDFRRREELIRLFEERRAEICASAPNKWEEVHIALGIAIYDPELDSSVSDAVRRADKIMYENKRIAKSKKH
ncbi:diguanylate cyclase (GGDEF) domain-containing protein [Ruminococcaceae bacterium FB2012]|nr:diguanylate cyclase (GGDEF) domain-containing protein [Ruminococcaceae bacterium FB2012]